MTSIQKRIIGTSMALFSGAMYGVNFNPTQHLLGNAYIPGTLPLNRNRS